MAMILQKTRLRLTQAIFFGKPQASVGVGFVKTNGTTPLTANWNAGNFIISSQNSTLWFNAVAYGADRTGSGDSTAAIQAAVNAAATAGGVAYIPRGVYKVTSTISSGGPGLLIQGDGKGATFINFVPAGAATCFKFTAGASTVNNCGIRGMTFQSTDLVQTKTAIEVIDAVNFEADSINITGNWTGAGFGCIGLKVSGRQEIRISRLDFNAADFPFRIGLNPNVGVGGQISFDHSSITDSQLVVTLGATANQAITVDDGVLLSNCKFARLALVRGNGAFKFNNTLLATASYEVQFDNIRTEQTTGPGTGYAIDMTATTGGFQSTSIQNLHCDAATNCIRLSLSTWPKASNITYGGTGTFLNLSGTVSNFKIDSSFRQAGSTITDASVNPTGIDLISGANPGVTTFGTLAIPSGAPPLAVGGASQFRVDATGQVGLAGAIPDTALTLAANSTQHWQGGTGLIYAEPAAPGATNLSFNALSNGAPGYLANGASMRMESDGSANGTIRFATTEAGIGNFERITVSNQGNVGFGATTPTRTIDLNGTQRFRGIAAPAVSEANSGTLYFDSATNKIMASLNGSAYVSVIGSGGLTGSGTVNQLTYFDGVTDVASDPNLVRGGGYALTLTGDLNFSAGANVIRIAGSTVFSVNGIQFAAGGGAGTLVNGDTALGSGALANSTGAGTGGNTAVGLQAGLHTTTGHHNTFVGLTAGGTNTVGNDNVVIGYGADVAANNLTNAIAIGSGALVSVSNGLILGTGGQKVGIRTNTPAKALHVAGGVAFTQTILTLANGLNSDIPMLVESSSIRIIGPTGGFSIGGFAQSFVGGQVLYVYNAVAQQMTIVNEDAGSTAINRIKTLTGGNVVLRAGTSACTFVYDDTDDRLILISSN